MEDNLLQKPYSLSPENLTAFAFRYAGKRLLRNEIHLDENTLNQLLLHSYFKKTKTIEHRTFYSFCTRCGNRKRSLLGFIPCQKCHTKHLYCRNCIQMGRVMECESFYEWTGPQPDWSGQNEACTWTGTLTNVQQNAAKEMIKAIRYPTAEILVWEIGRASCRERV